MAESNWHSSTQKVTDPKGLHGRHCDSISRLALQHPGQVRLLAGRRTLDAKSPLEMCLACIQPNTEIKVEVEPVGNYEELARGIQIEIAYEYRCVMI